MKNEGAPAISTHRIYGLTVQSDIFLPELQAVDCKTVPDIIVRQNSLPSPVSGVEHDKRSYLDGNAGRLWLDLPDIMRMEITDGHTITYDRDPGIEDDEVRLFVLGSGLGALLMQRGHLVVHGNAIVSEEQDGCFLCIGESGSGKSTTAVAMMRRGLKVLADDVCPLDEEGLVLPGMARAKLWQDTARQFGLDTSRLSRIRKADEKFSLPLGLSHCETRQPVRACYWLVPDDVDGVSISPVEGVEKFTVLRNNVYRPEYLRPLGLEEDYLRRLALMASTTPVYRVSRPRKGFDVDGLVDAILTNNR